MESPNATMSDHKPTRSSCELILMRHAPADTRGRLCGRTDVDAILPAPATLAGIAASLGPVDRLVVSPARRCVQTARGLFPQLEQQLDPQLWEQDFGAWEGRALSELPDLGPLSPDELARHAPPGGESFAVVCARIAPALRALPAGRSLVVAHAGTVRAALALALGAVPPALAFEVAPLSATSVRLFAGGASVSFVNRTVG